MDFSTGTFFLGLRLHHQRAVGFLCEKKFTESPESPKGPRHLVGDSELSLDFYFFTKIAQPYATGYLSEDEEDEFNRNEDVEGQGDQEEGGAKRIKVLGKPKAKPKAPCCAHEKAQLTL